MADQTVVMDQTEWQGLLQILCTIKEHPWVVTNPLIMKIGNQLQAQTPGAFAPQGAGNGLDPDEPPSMRRVPRPS